MNYENILTTSENGIATVTINRPTKLNALNKATIQELHDAFEALEKDFPNTSLYKLWLVVTHDLHWKQHTKTFVEAKVGVKNEIEIKKMQHRESVIRFQAIKQILAKTYQIQPEKAQNWQAKLDRIFTHAICGYVFFFGLLFVMFQSIFHWSSIPMDFIDEQFANLSSWVSQTLPVGMLNSLITEGVIPGIGGVVIFMPQIAFLFLFISLLEESGYMSRVVVLMDRIMKPFGMNGKSIIPLISGTACAIPAVMATRNIENWRERLITILITPFTTCSARIPVYTILIALVIPLTFKDWKRILMLVTSFTVGHTIALLLTIYEIITVKVAVIELLIPITILIMALFHLFTAGKSSKKEGVNLFFFITLFFGIIHGLGFLNYFNTLHQEASVSKLLAVLGSSLGIEAAQLVIIFIVLFSYI